ncbi:MAG: chemotaxis protein [Desulfobacteraceae bacterium]|nr:MAG: chemotaxis protein [Desulfobacteraceae bacterium]
MLNKFKLSTRIILLGVLIIFGFSLTIVFLYPKIRQNMYDAKYLKTRHVVETAWGVLEFYAKQVKAGALPMEEGKKQALQVIKNLRYEKDDYFWINDMKPRMIMHPIKAELDGKDLSENMDPNGKRLFVAFADKVKNEGAGFVDYYWAKPGESKPVPKISYVKGFPEWGWIIGSGIYIDDVEKELNPIFYYILTAIVIIGAAGLLFAYFMARSISRPINEIVTGLNEGADQVASASGQVSSASQSLAEGASEQAASIEETSSSLEEMSSMTKQNADNATQADNLMKETKRNVGTANESMGSLTESMNAIAKASDETAKIIKTIDEIAFQTNLLALNAAVEAARAGEAGAGFAVVADEVRNLAMRAADAAKNTANLIEETVKKVKNGSELVARTNEAFREVSGSATKVAQLVGEIAAASNEQAQGIDQVNKAVAEMDKVVQQNAATAEESASASEEMSAQANEMKGFVNELVTLVTGNGNNGGQESVVSDRRPNQGALPSGPRGIRKPEGRIALKNKKPAASGSRDVDPKRLIPMGDGEFKDF